MICKHENIKAVKLVQPVWVCEDVNRDEWRKEVHEYCKLICVDCGNEFPLNSVQTIELEEIFTDERESEVEG